MTSYECVCETFDGDPVEWSATRIVKARKEHKCCECRDVIRVGERHELIVLKLDGQFNQQRTCAFCAAERDRIAAEHPDLPPVYGELACWLVAELRGEL